ncbi:MAG: alpha/beta hydrolase [Chloroflexota bacterium]|nr:alpha/beta hydrolase [Chloroflexota bacterium]
MSATTIDGDLVQYEVLGRGRPVVLLHGWIGSWRYWVPTMQQLQSKFRVYAPTLFGFGESSKNPQKYSIEHQLRMLDAFTQELGMPKVALVGHGLGAQLAAEFAWRYPERVPRLMLVNAPLFDTGDLQARSPVLRKVVEVVNRPQSPPSGDGYMSDAPTIMNRSTLMLQQMRQNARIPPEAAKTEMTVTLKRYDAKPVNPLKPMFSDNSLEALLGRCFKRGEPNYDKLAVDAAKTDPRVLTTTSSVFDAGQLLDTLWLLQMPTLVLHGANDRLIEPPNRDVARHVTQEKTNLLMPAPLPNVGHFPMLEYERFASVVSWVLEAPELDPAKLPELFRSGWERRVR